MKDKRKDHTAELLNKLKHPLQPKILWLFTNEKNICQDMMANSQNNHWLLLSTQDVRILMKSKHPVHIMVFGVVTGNSDIMPPFIFLHGLRLNMETYIKCLEEAVLPWIKRMDAGRLYSWQQSFVPCSTSSQCWLSEIFCKPPPHYL